MAAPDETNLVVDLPDSFQRPVERLVPPETGYGYEQPPAVEVKGGVSRFGAFFLAIFAQILVFGGLGAAAYFYPQESADALRKVAQLLDREGPTTQAEATPWIPPEPTSTLGDRIQILELEDRAIYRGDRTAFAELQRRADLLEDDTANPIFDAVHASLVRIRQLYQVSAQNAPPVLDAQAIFPGAQTEPDLPTASVIQVLRDRRHSAPARERAAYLLADVKTAPAQKALFNTIQDDPNLQVVAQAFTSFRKSTGYPGNDWFNSEEVETWWFQNAPTILGRVN